MSAALPAQSPTRTTGIPAASKAAGPPPIIATFFHRRGSDGALALVAILRVENAGEERTVLDPVSAALAAGDTPANLVATTGEDLVDPIRIAQQRTAQGYHVRLTGFYDPLSHLANWGASDASTPPLPRSGVTTASL